MIPSAYLWRTLRWEADMPLQEEQPQDLLALFIRTFQQLGTVIPGPAEGDRLTFLLRHERFSAPVQRDMVLWLCAHALMETAELSLDQQGTVFVGQERTLQEDCLAAPVQEISQWWSEASPISAADARQHRAQLTAYVKRRQYQALAGYVSRTLRGSDVAGQLCYGFVPLVIGAIWREHPEISLNALVESLNLGDMARRPKETLLAWLATLPGLLKQSPSFAAAGPIDKAIQSLQADCSLPYSQQNLSRSLGLTPAYFCRLFQQRTGCHFSTYLTRLRMEKAQELLTDGVTRTLSEVGAACGYPNKSYFCQVFKKYTGFTPGEFQDRARP